MAGEKLPAWQGGDHGDNEGHADVTYADVDFIPEEREGDRQPLFDGVLVVAPSPAQPRQRASGHIVRWLTESAQADDLGEVFSDPVDVVFALGSLPCPTSCSPAGRAGTSSSPKAIEGAPDLILEILSPSTKCRDLRTKRALSERFGGREYWMVEPKTRTATVDALIGERYAPLLPADGLIRSTVIPGPEVAVVAPFSDL